MGIKSASNIICSRRPTRNSRSGRSFSRDFDFTFAQNHRPDWNKSFGRTPLHVPNHMTRWAIPAAPRHEASQVMDGHGCHTIVRIRCLNISNLKVHVTQTLQDEEVWICRQWFVLAATVHWTSQTKLKSFPSVERINNMKHKIQKPGRVSFISW